MRFEEKVLKNAAKNGSDQVAQSLSKFSKSDVDISISGVKTIPFEEFISDTKEVESQAVIVYAQILTGVEGVSVLMLSRENALTLIDLLNQQEVGTTSILTDIDRSAIKETLNILSNSYITSLADSANIDIGVSLPRMITSKRLKDIVKIVLKKEPLPEDSTIVFETVLKITEHKINVNLLLLFNSNLVNLIKLEPQN